MKLKTIRDLINEMLLKRNELWQTDKTIVTDLQPHLSGYITAKVVKSNMSYNIIGERYTFWASDLQLCEDPNTLLKALL